MAANIIDTCKIVIGADTKEVENGMRRVEQTLSGGLQNILNNFVAPLSAALAGAKLFGDYTAQADAIGKMSVALGVDGEALQAWGEAAARAGGSAQGLQGSVRSLNRGIQEFARTGKGRAAESLKALGLDRNAVRDAQGNAKDVFSLMQILSEKAESMDKAKFAGIAERLGLDQGTIMLLQSGRVAVDELVARQKSLGVYTEKDFEVTAAFNDAIADLGQVFKTVAAVVMRVITPVITKVAGWLTEGILFIRQHEPLIIAFFFSIAAAITAKLMPALMLATKTFLATGAQIMLSPWGAIAALIAGIAIALDDLYAYLQGGDSQFADFWATFGTPEGITENLNAVIDVFKQLFDDISSISEKLKPIFGGILNTIGRVAVRIIRLFELLGGKFLDLVEAIQNGDITLPQWIQDLSSWVGGILDDLGEMTRRLGVSFDFLGDYLDDALSGNVDIFADFSRLVTRILDNLSALIADIWSGITSPVKDAVTRAVIWFKELYGDIAGIFADIAGIFEPVTSAIGGLADWLADIFAGAFGAIRTAGGTVADALSNLFSGAVNAVAGAFRWVADIAQGIFSRLLSAFDSVADSITEAGAAVVEYLAGAFGSAFAFIADIFTGAAGVFDSVAGLLRDIWSGICNFFVDAWDGVISWISNKLFGFIDSAKSAWNDVKSFFGFGDDAAPEPVQVGSRGNNSRISFTQPELVSDTSAAAPAARTDGAQPIASANRAGRYTAPERKTRSKPDIGGGQGDIKVLPSTYQAAAAVQPSRIENKANVNNDTQVNISNIEVTTQATDAAGIAAGLGNATINEFKSRDLVVTLDSGVYK